MGLIIGLFVVVAIAAIIVGITDYTSVPRSRIEEMKKRRPCGHDDARIKIAPPVSMRTQ
jgi:hypothetical protein